MRLSSQVLILIAIVAIFFGTETARSVAEDKVVGIVWQLGYKGKNGKPNWIGRFRATPDGKVWAHRRSGGVPKIVGTWTGTEEKTLVKVDGFKVPEFNKYNGDYEIVLVGKNPKVWQGEFTNARGAKRPILVKLLKD